MRTLVNSGRTGGAGFCFVPLRETRGPMHEWSTKSLAIRKQLLCNSDKSFSWTQGTETVFSMLLWGQNMSKSIHGDAGWIQPHRWLCIHKFRTERDTPKPWISLPTLTKLQQMFSLGRMPASSTAGWHSERILFHILPFILSHWEETSREREITGLQQIQEIFRKPDDWKIQIRGFSDKLKQKKKKKAPQTNKQK